MRKQHTQLLLRTLYLLLLFAFFSCSDTAGSGSGTATGNPIIIGTVTDSTGSPIANAKVIVRPTEYLANNRNIDYLGEGTDKKGYAYTDKNGYYELEIKDIDEYYVEVMSSDSQTGIVQTIKVTSLDSADTFRVENAVVAVLDTMRGDVTLFGGPLCPIEIIVLGRTEVDTIMSTDTFELILPPGPHNLMIRPVDSTTYGYWMYNGFDATTYLSYIQIMAYNPISNSRACDSLLLFEFLIYNGYYDDFKKETGKVLTTKVRDSIISLYSDFELNGRITKLDITSGNIQNKLGHFAGLTELTWLRIDNCNLKILTDRIGELQKVDTFSISGNSLTTLPLSIIKMPNIKYLDLAENYLSNLPDDVKEWADSLDPDWATTQKE